MVCEGRVLNKCAEFMDENQVSYILLVEVTVILYLIRLDPFRNGFFTVKVYEYEDAFRVTPNVEGMLILKATKLGGAG